MEEVGVIATGEGSNVVIWPDCVWEKADLSYRAMP